MMKCSIHLIKRLCASLLCALLVLVAGPVALAAEGSVIYEGDTRELVFLPGSKESPTDLFHNLKDVMPGDVITQKILVKNNGEKGETVKLYLRSQGAKEGSEDFLSQLQLTVSGAEGTPLFVAPASQRAGLTDWVCLGTFEAGAEVELDLKLEVPLELGDGFQNTSGTVVWEFMAEEYPASSEDVNSSDMPKTQDVRNIWLYSVLALVAAIGIVVIVLYRRRKTDEKTSS